MSRIKGVENSIFIRKIKDEAERRGRVEELEHIAKLLNSNYTGFEDWLRISKYVVKKLKVLGGKP